MEAANNGLSLAGLLLAWHGMAAGRHALLRRCYWQHQQQLGCRPHPPCVLACARRPLDCCGWADAGLDRLPARAGAYGGGWLTSMAADGRRCEQTGAAGRNSDGMADAAGKRGSCFGPSSACDGVQGLADPIPQPISIINIFGMDAIDARPLAQKHPANHTPQQVRDLCDCDIEGQAGNSGRGGGARGGRDEGAGKRQRVSITRVN